MADCSITPTLKLGSKGTQVTCLQTSLGVIATGNFGSLTKQAVINFQKANGLTADGIVGPKVIAALKKKISSLNTNTTVETPQTIDISNAAPSTTTTVETPQTTGTSDTTILTALERLIDLPDIQNKLRGPQGPTGPAGANGSSSTSSSTGVLIDSNCNQSKYFTFGKLCQSSIDGKLYKPTGTSILEVGAGSSTGDFTGPSASSDGELVLFSGTGGKTGQRSNTLNGIPFLTNGVVSTKSIGTDIQVYSAKLDAISALPNSSGVLTNDGAGNFSYGASGVGSMVYPSSGLAVSNGSAWTTPATYSNITGLWTTCSGYLKSDGTCDNPSSTGANASGYYLVNQTTNAPTNAINLGALGSGILKQSVSGGVATMSTASAGTDYQAVLTNPLVAGTLVNGNYCTKNSATNTIDCNSSGTGSMTYPGAGLAVSTGSAWGDSLNITGISDSTSTTSSTTAASATAVKAAYDHAGSGTVTSSGTPTVHQWPVWTTSTDAKGVSVAASSVVCTDANGEPTACVGISQADDHPRAYNLTDSTKQIQDDVSAVTHATTRTIHYPDGDVYPQIGVNQPTTGYRISPAVASNNLTVTLLAGNGNAISTTNPVYTNINGVPYTLTAPLTLTLNAGTNWFGSGGVLLAAQNIDYFLYLTVHSGVVYLGMARVPYGLTIADFSATNTNEAYFASGGSTTSTDPVQVIGRTNATLGGTATFYWAASPGTVTLNYPIYSTRTLLYTPAITCNGSPAGSATWTLIYGSYQITYNNMRIQDQLIVNVNSSCGQGTGGYLNATSPFNVPHDSAYLSGENNAGILKIHQTNTFGNNIIIVNTSGVFTTANSDQIIFSGVMPIH